MAYNMLKKNIAGLSEILCVCVRVVHHHTVQSYIIIISGLPRYRWEFSLDLQNLHQDHKFWNAKITKARNGREAEKISHDAPQSDVRC